MILRGIAASDGIGLGRAVCVREENLDYSDVAYSGKESEKARLQAAIEEFEQRTSAMAEHIRQQVGDKESEILTGQIAMLADPFMRSQMQDAIDGGACAEAAVDNVCTMYADMFAAVEDEMMRQRATDVKDIRSRLLGILLGAASVDLSNLPAGTVLVTRELTPSMTVGLQKENVAAIITATGGKTSHSAILARALQVPAVLSVTKVLEVVQDGDGLIVDGGEGIAILNPDERTRSEYLTRQKDYQARIASLKVYQNRPTVDADGKRYQLFANIGSAAEAEVAAQSGAEGIGLFRTEFLFMDRTSLPDEMVQYEAYRAVSQTMAGKEVIIRTLDVGGDKAIEYLGMEKEENPFLGHRAIRYCLDRPDLYKVQLRALLRAGAEEHNIKIMLPLVTSVDEVRAARELLEQCKQELSEAGLPYDKDIALGVMIETPAAALTADLLARESDFFSIGTNDLTQYTMAVDRGNAQVASLYTPFQPAVLRSIRSVITAAKEAGIPVGMCGEAAADPGLIPLLMAWGLDEFSVSTSSVLATRASIHRWREDEVKRIAQEALGLSTASGVEGYLKKVSAPEK
ncbi:phosphoenolpyruvate--protein phosphotransferase [Dysosmobacter sp.]|uniref:phosphoenolpyruvate--protein phosphotransferase n=1 Tax=Dysosmobacter sp. TaxID=2591382 RepID=UPI002A9AD721|nr:phosphoenolpyruvate--protein phosphotransferase [Dysosmobacter sp.]MCI6053921.1 phosphoenolpyruvate--protein phosphotransferase [Dysosmobacter sp.]MDY5508982.1 phosphoenolpyruvate--protein phosphotransferase [Dysosmobacter sp.]